MAKFHKITFLIASCFLISTASLADEAVEQKSLCEKICELSKQFKLLSITMPLANVDALCKCAVEEGATTAAVEREKAPPPPAAPRGIKRPVKPKPAPPPPPEKPVLEPPAPEIPSIEPPPPEKPVMKPIKRKPRSAYDKVLPLPESDTTIDEDDEDFKDPCPRICTRRLGREHTGEMFFDTRTDKKACGCFENPKKKG
jgi:hypothetical protein